jgi:hypothetical protein
VSRQFSTIRRRPKHVDIITPFVYGTAEYRLKYATNFDGVFNTIIAAPATGYLDPQINQATVAVMYGNNVRIIFDPTNPAYGIASDTKSMWLQLARFDGAVETYVSPPTLLLPDEANHGVGVVTIAGTAPDVVSADLALQIDLPTLMFDMRVHVDGANPLLVSTELGGAETHFPAGEVGQFLSFVATQGSIFVRGSGGPTTFSMTSTRAFPK